MQHRTCLCICHIPILLEVTVTDMRESRVSFRLHVILILKKHFKTLFNTTTFISYLLIEIRDLLYLLYGQYANC